MDEPAHGSQQIPPETREAKLAEVEANAVQRDPTAAAIPTVTPSQPLAHLPAEMGGPAAGEAAPEVGVEGHFDLAPASDEGLELEADARPPHDEEQPAPEAAIWYEPVSAEPVPDTSPGPLFAEVAQAPEHDGGESSACTPLVDQPAVSPAPTDILYAAELEPGTGDQSSSLAEGPPAFEHAEHHPSPADASVTPVREDQVWSGPPPAPLHDQAPAGEVSEVHSPPQPGGEAHASVSASASIEAQPDLAVPNGAMAAVDPRPDWHSPMVLASQAAAIPSSGERAAVDALAYLRLAGRVAGAAVLAFTATVLLLVAAYRWIDPPTSTLMLGQRLSGTAIEQTWVPIERISPNLVHAVILSEDGGFCGHRGVDWPALGQAIENDRGGSTITMQVVKNLFLWPGRSYVRKALEIMLAYLVEAVWPKQRVLEIYLNIAEWGPGVFGVEAAAQHHFGKAAARLTAQEAALLAVSLPSPIERQSGYPGYQQRRLASNLLTRMRAVRTIRCVRTRRGDS